MSRKAAPAAVFLLLVLAPPWASGGDEAPQARTGGTLVLGTQPLTNLDPHFATSVADIQLLDPAGCRFSGTSRRS